MTEIPHALSTLKQQQDKSLEDKIKKKYDDFASRRDAVIIYIYVQMWGGLYREEINEGKALLVLIIIHFRIRLLGK